MLEASLLKYSLEYVYNELRQATDNFDNKLLLGSGSFGSVFRGTQRDGTNIAVKVLESPAKAGFEEEVRVLSKFRHPNLVILMGFARHSTQRMLVYEFLEGGDVYKRLQKSNGRKLPFLWLQRVGVAVDAACGLSHLHNSYPKVFHRDIKSLNILLDRNCTAKMADSGLACLSANASYGVKVKEAAGTVGYVDPLYVSRGIVTEGSEVFSFGVVLLELLTARAAAWFEMHNGHQVTQLLHAAVKGSKPLILALTDPLGGWPSQVSSGLADITLQCIASSENARPDFAAVVRRLRRILEFGQALEAMKPPSPQPKAEENPQRMGCPDPAIPAAAPSAPPQPTQQPPTSPGQQPTTGVGELPNRQQDVDPSRAPQYQVEQEVHDALDASVDPDFLWALEVTARFGKDATHLPRKRRVLTQIQSADASDWPVPTMRVGRLFQEDFFKDLLGEHAGQVSREHFQIWASMEENSKNAIPHALYLTNYSVGRTLLNGIPLDDLGQEAILQAGDVLGLSPSAGAADRGTPVIQFRVVIPEVPRPPSPGEVSTGSPSARSFESTNSEQSYCLLVDGCGVRPGLSESSRCFKLPFSQAERENSCIVGRMMSPEFWHAVLEEDSHQSMSRRHFELILANGQCSGAPLLVRCLSQHAPIVLRHCAGNCEVSLASGDAQEPVWLGDRIEILSTVHLTLLAKP